MNIKEAIERLKITDEDNPSTKIINETIDKCLKELNEVLPTRERVENLWYNDSHSYNKFFLFMEYYGFIKHKKIVKRYKFESPSEAIETTSWYTEEEFYNKFPDKKNWTKVKERRNNEY